MPADFKIQGEYAGVRRRAHGSPRRIGRGRRDAGDSQPPGDGAKHPRFAPAVPSANQIQPRLQSAHVNQVLPTQRLCQMNCEQADDFELIRSLSESSTPSKLPEFPMWNAK